MKKYGYAVLLGVLLAVFAQTAAFAGCCVIVTLDRLPEQVIAGQPLAIGFMVRLTDRPMGGEAPKVVAWRENSSDSFTVDAQNDGEGHYSATLNFPSAGTWKWQIDPFATSYGQPMPELTVLAAPPAQEAASTVPALMEPL
jgi:hypothetical protein